MIDLNYLYTYATAPKKPSHINPYDYFSAQAFTREIPQNWCNFYRGLIVHRLDEVIENPNLPVINLDLFLLALNEFEVSTIDFLRELQRGNNGEMNEIDKFFYYIYPESRIFSAFNEMRARGNKAYFCDVEKSSIPYKYNEICKTEFLFSTPPMLDPCKADFMYRAISVLNKKLRQYENPIGLSEREQAILYGVFYYNKKRTKPEIISKNWTEIQKYYSKLQNSKNIIETRKNIFKELQKQYFNNNSGQIEHTYPDDLVSLDMHGVPTNYENSKDAQIISLAEYEISRNGYSDFEEIDDTTRFAITKEQCATLKKQIIGQEKSIQTIINKLAGVSCGFIAENKPIASFLFNGPTGVGKTETAKAIAKTFFDNKIYTVDMSHYKNEDSLNRLTGSSFGYIGSEDKVPFIEFIQNNPSSVLLFDELDKASPASHTFLLSLLDEGKFTSAKGEIIDVSNCVIIATTNQKANTNVNSPNKNLDEMSSRSGEIGSPFVKELLGRFDNILEFENLEKADLKSILRIQLNKLKNNFEKNQKKNNIKIFYENGLLEDILFEATAQFTGARALKPSIQKMFVTPITDYLVENPETKDASIVVKDKDTLNVNGYDLAIDYQPPQKSKYKQEEQIRYIG